MSEKLFDGLYGKSELQAKKALDKNKYIEYN